MVKQLTFTAMKKSQLLLLFFAGTCVALQAQKSAVPAPTSANARLAGLAKKKITEEHSLVTNLRFRSVGPTVMSGRVVDVEVDPLDATKFYVAYASGGLWWTDNNGTTFSPVFDNEASMTIGDVAVDWTDHAHPIIWVGTGENNSSRSSYSGTGIYRSADGGKTWENRGLAETQHIGRVLVRPGNSNDLLVAAIGHLYTSNPERGVFRSKDGGKTWTKTLFINDQTGVIDLQVDAANPDIVYACAWQRDRKAWNFSESGKGSGIYKSTDGGDTWQLITGAGSGFPQGDGVGRIGVAIYNDPAAAKTGNTIVYAVLDNQDHRPADTSAKSREKLRPRDFEKMTHAQFLALDTAKLKAYLEDNGFPDKYPLDTVIAMVKRNAIQPSALYDYVSDANSRLFDTPVIGGEVYRSDDAGKTWKKSNTADLDNFYYTYGYYFGKVTIAPGKPDDVFIGGYAVLHSTDGGKKFDVTDGDNTHPDYHVIWCDPKREGHLITGGDGGVNISWDNGKSWFKCNTPAVGQFYSVNTDMAEPYNIYGGLQDNGVWYGPSTYQFSLGWYANGQYPWKGIGGGDGMQVMVDTRDNKTVYTGSQFGFYGRLDRVSGDAESVRPEHLLGEKPLRFNWQTPIWLSKHNQDVLYFGANKLFRSLDKGAHFTAISGDLTGGGREGDVPYGTLTTIHESPMTFGLIYTGSDDGYINVSRDGGASWKRISDGLPQHMRVNRVQASAFVEGRVYAALSGYSWDQFDAYVYVSEDFGKTWTRIGTDLPSEPVNVVREDPVNPDLLYVGTDNGLYASLDRGKTFMRMMKDLPAVAVHDLVIQPREHDLVVGTHGRSVYVAPVGDLEQLRDSVLRQPLHAFAISKVTAGDDKAELHFYAQQKGIVNIRLLSAGGLLLRELTDSSEAGLNFVDLPLSADSAHATAFMNESGKKDDQLKPDNHGVLALPAGQYSVEFITASATRRSIALVVEKQKHSAPSGAPERD